MIVAIIPPAIAVSVVRRTVCAVAVATTVMPVLIRTTGHVNTRNYAKQCGKKTWSLRWWAVIIYTHIGFYQRLFLFDYLWFFLFVLFFTQIFR